VRHARGRALAIALATALGAGAPRAAAAQASTLSPADPALARFADDAARHAARYADRRAAVADGYRRLGADFPGMGEHWLHPAALAADTVDAARPALLAYATVAGRPALLGVGFLVVSHGSAPPAARVVPGWPAAWHEHSGLLGDESGAAVGRANVGGTRVWVLHAWTALANPDGAFAADNWALPFARLGLAAPPGVDADAGRALSLASGGDAYLRAVLVDAGVWPDDTAAAASAAARALAVARDSAAALATRARVGGGARPVDLDALRATWRTLGAALEAALGPRVTPFLAPPHPVHPVHAGHAPAVARDGR
jgi:hypothetical protein